MAFYNVRFVDKISPSDKDVMGPVNIPDVALENRVKLGAALRKAKVLAQGARVSHFRLEGKKVIVFPSFPGLSTYWHSISLTPV